MAEEGVAVINLAEILNLPGTRKLSCVTLKCSNTNPTQQWSPGRAVTVLSVFSHAPTNPGGWIVSKTSMTVSQFLALGVGSVTNDVVFNGQLTAGTVLHFPGGFEVAANETVYVNLGGTATSFYVTLVYLT